LHFTFSQARVFSFESCRRPRSAAFFVPTNVRWKLPENRAQFFLKRENAGSKEIRQRHFNLTQFFHVGDETCAFDAKEKIFRRFLVPVPIARRSLQQIKRSVDLNGIECAGGEFQFASMWPSLWIKHATPAGIIPTGNANANLAFHTRFNRKSGATSILFRRQRR